MRFIEVTLVMFNLEFFPDKINLYINKLTTQFKFEN